MRPMIIMTPAEFARATFVIGVRILVITAFYVALCGSSPAEILSNRAFDFGAFMVIVAAITDIVSLAARLIGSGLHELIKPRGWPA